MKVSLTEKENAFLDALFSKESNGDYRTAMDVAGYSKNEYPARLMRRLKEDIIERAEMVLAANAPKAVLSMTGILDDPSALGNRERLATSKEILDRVGLVRTEKVEHKGVASAVVLLPPLKEDKDEDAEEE
jgi:hypothetical protein|tara:strand:+ start:1011 stop:1403 length:393 start_codon:yes stop_codon:yes gene_type:complete